jgi:hypothetical protein
MYDKPKHQNTKNLLYNLNYKHLWKYLEIIKIPLQFVFANICKHKMNMFLLMFNFFENSCKKDNKVVIKQ